MDASDEIKPIVSRYLVVTLLDIRHNPSRGG